jgi:hypothetical protein
VFRPCLGILFLFIAANASSQDVIVSGTFRTDSLLIGEPVAFSLTASYPSDLQLLFPDSTYDFTPYELESKRFFTTQTADSLSYDSVVYNLTSYEVDSVQTLRLPVFVVYPGDCTQVWSRADTIFLKHLVTAVPDSVSAQQLPLKTNTEYLAVSWMLNYPILLMIAGGIIVALVVFWLAFGKRIRQHYRVKRLRKNHYSFLERYEYAVQQVQSGFSSLRAETALVIWKKYMEALEGKPYTKFTSREIAKLEADDSLASALKVIDRMVYGGLSNEPRQAFSELQNYTQAHYDKKLKEVSNG